MKKLIKILIFVLMMTFPLLIVNDYIFAGEVNTNSVIEEAEERFFNQMQKKEANERDNILVIDTVNKYENDEYFIDGDTKISKKAAIYELINSSKVDAFEKIDKFKLDKDANIQNEIVHLKEILEKDKPKYSELYDILESMNIYDFENNFLVDIIPKEKVTDSNEFKTMTTYYYYDINVGYYEDYNTSNTIAGTFTKQAEYYLIPYDDWEYGYPTSSNMYFTVFSYSDGYQIYENIYTGNVRYVINGGYTLYPHQDVITFDYQSYDLAGDDFTAPYATISLINDYWGEEKMYISSDVIGVPFKITKAAHYNRNVYNKINGTSINILYPTEASIAGAGFTDVSEQGTYFHKLLTSNTGNNKYTKKVVYHNLNADRYSNGSVEIVYKSDGSVEYEDLVTFTFNFGDRDTYPDGAIMAYDSHWILDVYPYLIWGNSQVDADNHSAFERFVWDKDSAKAAYNILVVPDYECRNLQRNDLIEMYVDADTCGDGCVGNADATPIPDAVQDGSVLFYDTGNPYFDAITTKYFSKKSYPYNIDWTSLINNEFDNSLDFNNLIYLEVSDPVNFMVSGTYHVIVGLKDQDGNQFNRTFMVIISGC